jgi:hypothetical protein
MPAEVRVSHLDVRDRIYVVPGTTISKPWPGVVKSSGLKVKSADALADHRVVRPAATLFFGALSNNAAYDLALRAMTVPSLKNLFSSKGKAVCGDNGCGGGRRED